MNKTILKFLMIILLLGGCQKKKEPESGNNQRETGTIVISQEQFSTSNMALGTLQQKEFPDLVHATGRIDVPPQYRARISTYHSGYVVSAPLLVGNTVKKGDFLLSIENPEFIEMQEEYLKAHEQLKYLKAEFERQKTLMDEKITSQKRFLETESNFQSMLARYKSLKSQLKMLNFDPVAIENGELSSRTSLYAPISGTISQVDISIGSFVSPQQTIMGIVNTDHIHLELEVFEKDVADLRAGQKIRFTLPESNTDTLDATVFLIGNTIDTKKRTVMVHAHLETPEETPLAVGMYVDAQIITNNSMMSALPKEAVISSGDAEYVLVKQGSANGAHIFKRIAVNTGPDHKGYRAIKESENLKTTDTLLVKGGFSLITQEE
ncbi:efflux RND transporter periplasmic adaptor subunit [Robertkochia aurantiaca]|uniref:efflux RND transporter periplasmic adaptor subunit n=1 Tax=Robertkochia aurantiaca TaxID=2873700 RepID=UPI001CCB6D59|nr:efflux RND transporter periplasmic adaptor subunit [Robertkochia sp. 3YJGBD-33]